VPRIGIAGAPVSVMLAFGLPCIFMFVKTQRGEEPIEFPYLGMARAILMAVAISLFFHYIHPVNKWLQLAMIVVLMISYIVALFVTRVIPKQHRAALAHVARSAYHRGPHGFNRHRGLRSLEQPERRDLRKAIVAGIPVNELGHMIHTPAEGDDSSSNGSFGNGAHGNGAGDHDESEAERLVHILRKVGKKGGLPEVGDQTEYDARMAKFLFADVPVAARIAAMRGLLAAGADSNDLRALEELKDYLAKTPKRAWRGKRTRVQAVARRLPIKGA
jgi:Ca2+/Na+ antiporter